MTLREWMYDQATEAARETADHERFADAFEEAIEPLLSDPYLQAEATERLKEKYRGKLEEFVELSREGMENLNEALASADPDMREETAWYLAQQMKNTDLSAFQGGGPA